MNSTMERYSLGGRQRLPPAEGPKLHPFRHRQKPFELIELLSDPDHVVSSEGGDGHVFKIRIEETFYALKVFRFFNVESARTYIFPFHNHNVNALTFVYHSAPFFAECRAYGRISEIQQERLGKSKKKKIDNIAVPCYGFMGLPAVDYEDIFHTKFGVTDWGRSPSDLEKPLTERRPFHCIVKEFVGTPRSIARPAKMLRDLKRLRNGGIYQRDIHTGNYKDGLLVDFGQAWTEPHWTSEVLGEENLKMRKDRELYDFDAMLRDESIKTHVRATRHDDIEEKLRPRRQTHYRVK